MKKLIVIIGVFALSIIFVGVSYAGTSTGSLTVTAAIPATCSILSGSLSFGSYNNTSGNTATGTAMTLTCSNGTEYWIYTTIPYLERVMTREGGGGTLPYKVYKDDASTELGIDKDSGLHGVSAGLPTNVILFGSIAAGLNPPVGNYSHTLTITVEY